MPVSLDKNLHYPAIDKFYKATITQERSGKPLPILPIKLMGENPFYIGQRVASLTKGRYSISPDCSLEVMPQGQLVSLLLTTSYLIVKFEPPCPSIKIRNRYKGFSMFVQGIEMELAANVTASTMSKRARARMTF